MLKQRIKEIASAYRAENSYPVDNLIAAVALIDNGNISEAYTLIASDLKEFMRHSESSQQYSFAITELFKAILAEPNEPNYFDAEPNKPIYSKGFEATEPNEPKNNHSSLNEPQIRIGDRVSIFNLRQACEKFKKDLPPDGYTVRELAGKNGHTEATIKHPSSRASYVVPVSWLFVVEGAK